MLKKNGTKIATFGRIGENSNVWKDKCQKSKVYKKKKETRIVMFGKGNKNYNVSKDTARIPRYTGIGTQFQSL